MRRAFSLFIVLSVAVWPTIQVFAAVSQSYQDHISGKESSGSYSVYNAGGHTEALGRYQFIPSTFAAQGYMTYTGGSKKSWSSYEFNDAAHDAGVYSVDDLRYTDAGHNLQDAAFDRFTASNASAFSSATRAAIGTTVNGVTITEEGLLSAAHFLGVGALNDYVASGFDPSVLPADYLSANGFSSYAELNDYLMKRIADASGSTWDGGSGDSLYADGYGQDGMYDATEGFPGFGSKRPTMIQEIPPFQGRLENLTAGAGGQ